MTKSKSVFHSVMCLGEIAQPTLVLRLLVVDNETQKGKNMAHCFWVLN